MSVVLQTSPFDQVFGLPLHPLVVHAAVVLLPLAALAVLACVLVPPLRRRFGGLTVALLAAGAGAAFVARLSGEQLAERVERPVEHAFWGGILPWVAIALLVAAAVWWAAGAAADRRARTASGTGAGGTTSSAAASSSTAAGKGASPVGTISGGIAAILALVVLGMTVVVGHSGSAAVWGDLPAPGATPTASPTPEPSATPEATPLTPPPVVPATPTASATQPATALPTPSASVPAARYTLAEVQQRNSSAACWAVVDGTVYDLTDWISRHPGGAQRILGLCGRDASADFAAQHASDALPNETIASFRIGELAR